MKIKNVGEVMPELCKERTWGRSERYYGEEGQRPETWCLECVQGKNPIREQFE